MRMRFKPYAGPELRACPFHVNEPMEQRGNGTDCLPSRPTPCIWNWAAEKAAFGKAGCAEPRRSTMWAST